MNIAVASDHGGYKEKEQIVTWLREQGHKVRNFGTHNIDSCDYPDYAKQVCDHITNNNSKICCYRSISTINGIYFSFFIDWKKACAYIFFYEKCMKCSILLKWFFKIRLRKVLKYFPVFWYFFFWEKWVFRRF